MSDKPSKPYKDFPLFPHASGRWAKKIRGKFHYFGPWRDWRAAIATYQEVKDDLHAGRTPRPKGTGPTFIELGNLFLDSYRKRVQDGDIEAVTYIGYKQAIERMARKLPQDVQVSMLTPDDFAKARRLLAKGRSATTLANYITRLRVVFRFGLERGYLDKPVNMGGAFKRPSKRVLRLEMREIGPRLFEARHVRRIIRAANPTMRAMVLLGINAAFGNTDCANLLASDLDLKEGWVDFPRTKTGNERRCKLWRCTVDAIKEVLEDRPDKTNEPVFQTTKGGFWAKPNDRTLSKEFSKLLKRLGIYRRGLSFYTLRRTFRTVADDMLDQPAIGLVMGHIDNTMAGIYRQTISDARLERVSAHVAQWLFRTPEAIQQEFPRPARSERRARGKQGP